MKTLIEKFEKENEVLRIKYLLAKRAIDAKIRKGLMIVNVVGALITLILLYLGYLEKAESNDITIIFLILMVVLFILNLSDFTTFAPSVRSMYIDVNSKAKKLVKNEILPEFLSSLKKDFTLNKDFESNLISLIENGEKWIDVYDLRLVDYQVIDDRSLLMKRDGITYRLLYWTCSSRPDLPSLSDLDRLESNGGFVWCLSILSIEEKGK